MTGLEVTLISILGGIIMMAVLGCLTHAAEEKQRNERREAE